MNQPPGQPDQNGPFISDPAVEAALERFAAALETADPDWRSRLSQTEKFLSGHQHPIDPALLSTPPQES